MRTHVLAEKLAAKIKSNLSSARNSFKNQRMNKPSFRRAHEILTPYFASLIRTLSMLNLAIQTLVLFPRKTIIKANIQHQIAKQYCLHLMHYYVPRSLFDACRNVNTRHLCTSVISSTQMPKRLGRGEEDE